MPATFLVVESSDSLTHVEVSGMLDVASTREIELRFSASTAGRHKPLIVDLSRVTFLASAGMSMLIHVARTLSADKHPVVILAPIDAIEQALRIARLDSMMQIVATLQQAREVIASSAASR